MDFKPVESDTIYFVRKFKGILDCTETMLSLFSNVGLKETIPLGLEREKFPLTVFLSTGAENKNLIIGAVLILKLSEINDCPLIFAEVSFKAGGGEGGGCIFSFFLEQDIGKTTISKMQMAHLLYQFAFKFFCKKN